MVCEVHQFLVDLKSLFQDLVFFLFQSAYLLVELEVCLLGGCEFHFDIVQMCGFRSWVARNEHLAALSHRLCILFIEPCIFNFQMSLSKRRVFKLLLQSLILLCTLMGSLFLFPHLLYQVSLRQRFNFRLKELDVFSILSMDLHDFQNSLVELTHRLLE